MEKPGYYAVIPANVRYDKDLTANAKLLYGEISALAQKNGVCFATNEYFSNLYNLSERAISRLICSLRDKNYIKVAFVTDEANKRYRQICLGGIDKNGVYPIDKNVQYNNTSVINNTSIIKENIKESSEISSNLEAYKEIVNYMNVVNEHHRFNIKIPFSYKYQSKATQKLINARLREGYNIEEFKDVIWWGYKKFVENEFTTQNGESSFKYFRPSTLFSSEHFEAYLNEYRANTQ